MKFDAHVSNVGFILYLVARLFQSLRKQIRVLSHVFYFTFRIRTEFHALRDRRTYPPMKAYLLLLPISFLPAVAGILVTRPMWRIRQLPNEAIQGIGLVVMISVLIGYLVPLFLGDTGAVGCACILLSLFNLEIFQYYEQRLNTSRCPQCHTRNLHVRKYSKGLYKLYCPHCGLHSRWRTWRYFSDEA